MGAKPLRLGSVNYYNFKDIIKIAEVDGLAITRAALNPSGFIRIIRLVEQEARNRKILPPGN